MATKEKLKVVTFVTGNANKLRELNSILLTAGLADRVVSQNVDLPELQGTPETPPSFPRSVIAIGGASGFIGRHLLRSLRSAGHRVVSIDRRRSSRHQLATSGDSSDSLTWSEVERCGLPDGVEAVCCLSGRSILESGPALRLSAAAYRQYVDELFDSRIGRIRCLAAAAEGVQPKPPRRLVGVSAVGYYPSSGSNSPPRVPELESAVGRLGGLLFAPVSANHLTMKNSSSRRLQLVSSGPQPVYDEYYSGPADSSLAGRLCVSIEEAIFAQSTPATRRVAVRMGVALGRDGGALASMALPFRLGLGGPVASGRQPVAWVHIKDAVGVLQHALLADLPALAAAHLDVLNAVAPAQNTSSDLAAALAASLRRPAFLTTPAAVVRLMFGADRAGVLIDGAFVSPRRTQEAGYRFQFADLREAMRDIYGY